VSVPPGRLSAIRWAIIVDIFATWLLTLPVTMALGALWALLLRGLFTLLSL
jgi:phosphate/sulfate permease